MLFSTVRRVWWQQMNRNGRRSSTFIHGSIMCMLSAFIVIICISFRSDTWLLMYHWCHQAGLDEIELEFAMPYLHVLLQIAATFSTYSSAIKWYTIYAQVYIGSTAVVSISERMAYGYKASLSNCRNIPFSTYTSHCRSAKELYLLVTLFNKACSDLLISLLFMFHTFVPMAFAFCLLQESRALFFSFFIVMALALSFFLIYVRYAADLQTYSHRIISTLEQTLPRLKCSNRTHSLYARQLLKSLRPCGIHAGNLIMVRQDTLLLIVDVIMSTTITMLIDGGIKYQSSLYTQD